MPRVPKTEIVSGNSPSPTRGRRPDAAKAKVKSGPRAEIYKSKNSKATCPPAEPPSSQAVDDENHLLFFSTYDECAKYGSQIYSCNMKTAKWTKITVGELSGRAMRISLNGVGVNQVSLGTPERARQLPSRFGGAMAFYKSKSGQRMLLLFGGQIDGTNEHPGDVSNELIAVDLDALRWWVVDVTGGAVGARTESLLVVVDDQLFIFGGRTYEHGQYRPTDSYCVASLRNQHWTWDVRDAPYPPHVPALSYDCAGTVIPGGDAPKILLTAGPRVGGDEITRLAPGAFVVFDPGLRTFAPHIGESGTFPGNVAWYNIYNLPGSTKADPSATSAVLCTFDARGKLPELYIYSLPPHPRCGLRARIAEVGGTKFERFAVVGSKMYLLGSSDNQEWDVLGEIPARWVSG